jgi:hypothetical protein
MQQICPKCGIPSDGRSRFCTNCGTTLEAPQRYRQSWETPPAQNPAEVPSWAQAQGGMYQQQAAMGGQQINGSLGFGGQGDAAAKKLLLVAGGVILGALVLFIGSIALAIVTPAPISTFFWIVAILIFLMAWIIYSRIRRLIRRTIRGFERFF